METMFAIKLTVTPLLMLAASLVARRWGGFVGGIFSGMPLTSGPISLYLAIEQGERFAQRAAVGSLAGVGAVMLTYLCYIALSARYSLVLTCIVSLVIFFLSSWTLLVADTSALSVAVGVFAIAAALCFTRTDVRSSTPGRPPSFDLPARLFTATLMVLAITAFARILGPGISGVLSPTPLIAWPLTVFAHIQGGRNDALAVIRGNAISGVGIIVFYIFVKYQVTSGDLILTFLISTILSVFAAVVFMAFLRLRN